MDYTQSVWKCYVLIKMCSFPLLSLGGEGADRRMRGQYSNLQIFFFVITTKIFIDFTLIRLHLLPHCGRRGIAIGEIPQTLRARCCNSRRVSHLSIHLFWNKNKFRTLRFGISVITRNDCFFRTRNIF